MYTIREVRQRAGLTQAELAARLDLPQSEISRIETGRRRLTVDRLVDIARALEANPAKLLMDDEQAA